MQEAVEDGRREHVVAEDGAPLADGLVRRDEEAAPLVAPRDELEEQVRSALLEGQVAELVDDQQLGLREERELRVERAVGLCARERREERRRADDYR